MLSHSGVLYPARPAKGDPGSLPANHRCKTHLTLFFCQGFYFIATRIYVANDENVVVDGIKSCILAYWRTLGHKNIFTAMIKKKMLIFTKDYYIEH